MNIVSHFGVLINYGISYPQQNSTLATFNMINIKLCGDLECFKMFEKELTIAGKHQESTKFDFDSFGDAVTDTFIFNYRFYH